MVYYSSSVRRLSCVGRQDVLIPLLLLPSFLLQPKFFRLQSKFFHYHHHLLLLLLNPPSKKTSTRLGSSTRSIPFNSWTGELPHPRGHWRVRCSVEGVCEELEWGWDVELVGEEEQEVVLVDFELVA